MKQVRKVKYRKVQGHAGRYRFSGRVHLVFWYHDEEWNRKYWKYVCGKRQSAALEFDLNATDVDDDTPVTCLACARMAPDVCEAMDVIPSIDEFQPGGSEWVHDA